MSYHYRGRTYLTAADYQRAIAEYNRRQSEEQAGYYARENSRLAAEIAGYQEEIEQISGNLASQVTGTQAELAQTRVDVQRMQRLSQQIQEDVHAMNANVRHVETVQRQMEADMRRELNLIHDEVHLTEAEIAKLIKAHEAHVREVSETFKRVRSQMERGFQEAEAKRQQTERRLTEKIGEVDRKVVGHIQDEMARLENEMERAKTQIARAKEMTDALAAHTDRLGFHAEIGSLRTLTAQAEAALANKDATAALATSMTALSNATSLESEVSRRQVALEQSRRWVEQEEARLAHRMEDEDVKLYFASEIVQVKGILSKVLGQASRSYERYDRLQIDATRDETTLQRLEEQICRIKATVPLVKEMMDKRKAKGKEILKTLTKVYGAEPARDQRYLDPADLKSPLLVKCDFAGAKLDVTLDLDGTYGIDGYSHATNATCAHHATKVAKELKEQTLVTREQVDTTNRGEPLQQAASPAESWKQINDDLVSIRGRL